MAKTINKRIKRVAIISIIANVWFILGNIYAAFILYKSSLTPQSWLGIILGVTCYILLYICSISTSFSLLKLMKGGKNK